MPHRIKRAVDYPYPVPDQDFLFKGGKAQPFAAEMIGGDRTPVLAVGSNRAPEQLTRKYGDGDDVEIPVTQLKFPGFDVVYNAHMARYGSLPATIIPAPGVTAHIYVTWLTPPQLSVMHTTEGVGINTEFGVFEGLALTSGGRPVTSAWTYRGRHGAFAPDGTPRSVGEVRADNRTFPALHQRDVLTFVHRNFGEGVFDDWLITHIEDAEKRKGLSRRISVGAAKVEFPDFRVVEVSG